MKRYSLGCPTCGRQRNITANAPTRLCLSCSIKKSWLSRERRTMPTTPPYLGEIRYGRDINQKDGKHKYIFAECPICTKQRWVTFRGDPKGYKLRCQPCFAKQSIGVEHPNWKGGRVHRTEGYIGVRVYPEDFFYSMADASGYVAEHRLVMAKLLNRCLLPWEIIHHKNGDRTDNRCENLQLLPARTYHMIDTLTKSLLKTMQRRIEHLESLLREHGIEDK